MNLHDAEVMAIMLMNQYGLDDWTFQFDTARRRFGMCAHRRRLISLSAHLTELNSEDVVTDTLLHEIAHALVGANHGHDEIWIEQAVAIGCNGERCYSSDEVITPEKTFIGTCPSCGKTIQRFVRKRGLACGSCCKKHNGGKYSKQYKFKWKRRAV